MEQRSGLQHKQASRQAAAVRSAGISGASANITRLIILYCSWKIFLSLLAAASPGIGYDTSTDILLDCHASSSCSTSWLSHMALRLACKLTRWDAIYFAFASQHGLVYEQQWAFSPSLARVTSIFARGIPSSLCHSPIVCHALAGIAISHFAHLLSVIVLYRLTYNIIPAARDKRACVAFATACLHIFSPAGLFLSASYGEATSALTNFSGMYCYVVAQTQSNSALTAAFMTIGTGVAFGISSMVRSNGLLSGAILAWDAVSYIPKLVFILRRRDWPEIIRLGGILVGGIFAGVGYALPQAEAYLQYCTKGNTRPWCHRALPSIYTWVQDYYWDVGFLRYWTLSNLPLFLLASPMILVLSGTAWIALSRERLNLVTQFLYKSHTEHNTNESTSAARVFAHVMARFALPQLILVVLATTSFHVQIINRICSAYPVWYIILALVLHSSGTPCGVGFTSESILVEALTKNAQWIVRGAIMYAIIQGVLYASFMPPA